MSKRFRHETTAIPSGFFAPTTPLHPLQPPQGPAHHPSQSPLPPPPPPPAGSGYFQQQQILYNYGNMSQSAMTFPSNSYPPSGIGQPHSRQPPFRPHSQDHYVSGHSSSSPRRGRQPPHPLPSSPHHQPLRQPKPMEWKCEACNLPLESPAALKAHTASHITCSSCSFSAAPKIVKTHYQSVHGKFSQSGFKTVTIAVPGCPIQRFRICVGNHPEDVKKWIEERRKRFPRSSTAPSATVREPQSQETPKEIATEEKIGLSTLLDGYGSSSESEDEKTDSAPVPLVQDHNGEEDVVQETAEKTQMDADDTNNERSPLNELGHRKGLCRFFQQRGSCRNGANCPFRHEGPSGGPQPDQRSLQRGPAKRQRTGKTLLDKLLENEARREAALTIQLLEFLASQNYLEDSSTRS